MQHASSKVTSAHEKQSNHAAKQTVLMTMCQHSGVMAVKRTQALRLRLELRRYGRTETSPVPVQVPALVAMRVTTLCTPDTHPSRFLQPPDATTARQRFRQMLHVRNTANTGMLRHLCTRAASAAFRIPNTDGFMGRPLLETQKVDPEDVGSFWKKHDPPLGRSKDFWMTEEGRSLMTEWDNGTCPIPNVQNIAYLKQARRLLLKDYSKKTSFSGPMWQSLLYLCRAICHGGGLLHNTGISKRHRTADDSADHGKQHPGTWRVCSS